jgi:TolB-like protein
MKPLTHPQPRPAGAPHRSRLKCVWALLAWPLAMATLPLPVPAQPTAASAALPAVVVWDFDNQTPGGLGREGEYLRRALSENLTTQLLQVQGLPVVERQRLKDLLAEQKLAASELADEDARLRLGRIIGARRMVFGGFFVLAGQVQLHVRLVDTGSARVLFSDELAVPLDAVMDEVGAMNTRMVRALTGAASAGGAGQRHASDSWRAYDQALALADAGRLDDAIAALQALLARDAGFTPAERQLVALLERQARR